MRARDIEYQLRKFSALNPRKYTVDELSLKLGVIVQPFLSMLIGATFETLYRGRINEDPTAYFTNISELWYPPEHTVKRLGRFNNINESVFYAAGHHAAVARECSIKHNDVITMITCQKKTSYPLKVANIFNSRFLKNNEFNIDVDSIETCSTAHELLKTVRNRKKHAAIQHFIENLALCTVELEKQDKYKFSICVKNLFFAIPELDGLCYPSLALGGKNVNVALRPNAADRHYEAIRVTVLKYDQNTNYLECIAQSSSIDSATGSITYIK